MRYIILIILMIFVSCDEHVRVGASGKVCTIRNVNDTKCLYSLNIKNKVGFYSEDGIISTLYDSCGKFQIGDSVTLLSKKILHDTH